MSISDRDKKILIVFVGILIFVLVYFFQVRAYMENLDSIKADNISLNSKLMELQAKVAKEAEMKTETADLRAKTASIVAKFPSFLQAENEIMDMVEFEKELKIEVPSITVSEPVRIQTSVPVNVNIEADPAENTEGEETAENKEATVPVAEAKYRLYSLPTNINYKGGYEGLKEFIDRMAKSVDKKSINTVSVTFDNTTGLLDGNIIYDSFYLAGGDRPYEEIITKTIKHGTKNIFGTVDTSKAKKNENNK